MDKYFSSLEQKVDRVIAQCDLLRTENQQLRQALIVKSEELRDMTERMEQARRRLEQLVSRMPE